MYGIKDYAAAGGLMTYAADMLRQSGEPPPTSTRILKGAKPADLPVEQPTKFELVINLKTAKALGLENPAAIARPRRRSDRVSLHPMLLHLLTAGFRT